MLRGYLAGLLSGTVVSGAVLGAVSVLTDRPGETPPETTAVEVPAGSEFDQSRDDEAATLPRLQDTQTPDDVPQVTAPKPDDLSSLEGADTTSVAQPQTGAPESALSAPDTPEQGAGVRVDSEDPVLPNPQALAPEAPTGEDALSISTEPAQPVTPEFEEESAAFPAEDPTPEPLGAETASDTAENSMNEAAETATTGSTPQPESAPAATADTVEPEAAADLSTPQDAEESTAEAPLPKPADLQEQMSDQEPAQPASDLATAQATDPQAETETSTIGNLADGVTTGRLPTALTPEPAPAEDTAAPEPATVEDDSLPPLQRFAAEFENPENKPLMAIVLIDDGNSPIGPAALADFPYPLSFAVDASLPDAAQVAAKYRAAGLEVLAMADLPENATATDAEVAMETYLAAVPEAVAVFEGTGTGLQASRAASEQLAPILRDSGHGLVMFPNGLNTAQKLIAREGVPAATVFRDFDANGQNASAIRRFLDQAAFRAGQEEGGVIMVGRLRPDTISALLLWGLQDRAASVALAPVSAVLTAD